MKTVSIRVSTAAPLDVVMSATLQALRQLGGQAAQTSPNTIKITNGNENVQFAFIANINADINIQPFPGGYDITSYIKTTPNLLFWICAIVGFFFLWFLWIVCLLFFFVDPSSQYMRALNSIQIY